MRGVLTALGRPKVVALGHKASDELKRQSIAHTTAPHPQWWKRFRYRDMVGYTEAIQEAVDSVD
jgi:hypothetical protein